MVTVEFTYRSAKYRARFSDSSGEAERWAEQPIVEIDVHGKGWQVVKVPDKGLLKAASKSRA